MEGHNKNMIGDNEKFKGLKPEQLSSLFESFSSEQINSYQNVNAKSSKIGAERVQTQIEKNPKLATNITKMIEFAPAAITALTAIAGLIAVAGAEGTHMPEFEPVRNAIHQFINWVSIRPYSDDINLGKAALTTAGVILVPTIMIGALEKIKDIILRKIS